MDKLQDSGYATAYGSQTLPDIYFSPPHLKFINSKLKDLEPEGELMVINSPDRKENLILCE